MNPPDLRRARRLAFVALWGVLAGRLVQGLDVVDWAALWVCVAVVAGGVIRHVRWAVAAGLLAELMMVLGYYGSFGPGPVQWTPYQLFWVAAALCVGPLGGYAGHRISHDRTGYLYLVAALFVLEPFGWQAWDAIRGRPFGLSATDYAEIAVGLGIAAATAVWRRRG